MRSVFTEFVRQMEPAGPGPGDELVEQVWDALRGLLVSELKRRSSWVHPPSYLGIVGHGSWVAAGSGSDALDELVSHCFEDVFVRRLSSLRDQATRKETVDGLVSLASRHFLLEVQRKNDPLGFRVFEVLRAVVLDALAAGELALVAGDRRVRNDSFLAREPEARPEDLLAVDMAPLAERWAFEHLEALVTARRADLAGLKRSLRSELEDWMVREGRAGFRFGELAAGLKQRVRLAWAERWSGASEEVGGVRGLAASHWPRAEDRRRFRALSRCVRNALGDLDERQKTRRYLDRLWRFLETFAAEDEIREELGDLGDRLDLPSHRQLARLLDIPRERIPGLLEILRRQVRGCLDQVDTFGEGVVLASRKIDLDRRAAVRAAIQAAAARAPQAERFPDREGWRPGDILAIPAADRLGVHWLVLGRAEGGSLLCAPVDTFPLFGPGDLCLDPEGEGWSVRRGLALPVRAEILAAAHRVARIADETLERCLSGEDSEGIDLVEEDLPEYREWLDEGPRAAWRRLGRRIEASGPRPGGNAGLPWWAGLAAAALVATALGLAIQGHRLRLTVERLSRPALDVPYVEVQFDPDYRGRWTHTISPEATHVRLGMALIAQPEYEAYRIDLLHPDGELYHRLPRLPPRVSYTLSFPALALDRFELTLRLYGLSGDAATLLDEQELEVLRGEAP